MTKHLQNRIQQILLIWMMFSVYYSSAQIYVGSWNPIRYPNTGTCGWSFQDNGAAGTATDPYASIEKAMNTVVANGTTNQIINFLPDAYIQNWDYDSTVTEVRDNCDGHDLDYMPTITSALNGLQLLGSTQGCLTMLEALGTSNSLQFINISGADNITISNIYFKGYSQAVSINNSTNVTFTNCIFESCNYGITALDAILINSTTSNTSVTFNNCKFIDNTKNATTNALNIQSNSATAAVFTTVNFLGCEMVCNQKDNSGGSVYINGRTISNGTPTTVNFTGGVFANNVVTSSAGRGGALHIGNNSKVTIDGTYFFNNTVQTTGVSSPNDGGGAIYIYSNNTGLTAAARTDVSITNALFYGNKTTSVGNGGAIALIGASGHTNTNRPRLTITNTIFEKNKTSTSAKGGAIFNYYGELNISNSTFKKDTSGIGGAIAVENSTSVFTLANDSFINNSATTGKDLQSDANFTMSNCVTAAANIAGPATYNWILIDDFTRTNNNTVGNSWIEKESAATGAKITSNTLELNSVSLDGREWNYRTMTQYTTAGLTDNAGSITWAWNMHPNRSGLSGFDSLAAGWNYGIGFVLGATSSNIAIGNGYAVLIGQTGTSDPIRLVRFTGGLDANANLTNIISSTPTAGTYAGTEYFSIKVNYNPTTDAWSLFVESGASAFPRTDPRLTSTQIGTTTVNNTYVTNTNNVRFLGVLWNHAASGVANATFDDIYIQTSDGLGTGSTLNYVDASTLVSSYSCTNGYCAATVAATCLSNSLSNFICTDANATGSVSGIAFFDSNGNGIYDESLPLDSIYIILYDNNNNVIGRYTTDGTGAYSFNGLPSGTYKVAFTKLGYFQGQTLQNQGSGTVDSDIDSSYVSMFVTINTSLTNTENADNAVSALHHQNVSAGFLLTIFNVLPLNLISFNGEIKNCNEVKLTWKTVSEINVSHFEILRSVNGNEYNSIETIKAKGDFLETINTYSSEFIQNNNLVYYKLKMVDLDNSFKYSPIITIKNNCASN
ncbi:MAG TPA: SdrD B-like domain-containing protein, partial [Chitinophagales bacterium]|nr:SdrD B-like domain-containing protein [Chitinophagales bacterium]